MNMIDAVKTCVVEKYCCFTGRARRSEYWYFVLAQTILSWVVSFFGMVSINDAVGRFMVDQDFAAYMSAIFTSPAMIVSSIISLALLLPSLGVAVRRLHDIGKSGWWIVGFYVICCIPLVNFAAMIYALYLLCKDSEDGENEYGPNPKGVSEIGDSSSF